MANRAYQFALHALLRFLKDHLSAIWHLFSFAVIENIIILLKRLFVAWPSFLSLLIGVFLLTLSQVADLLARSLDIFELVAFIVFLLVFWIIPLHLGARILLNANPSPGARDKRKEGEEPSGAEKLDDWLPKDLGLLAILALFITIIVQAGAFQELKSHFPDYGLTAPDSRLWIVPIVCLVCYFIYLGVRERTNDKMSVATRRKLSIGFTVVSVVFVLIASLAPLELARQLGGLMFVPMMVGGWIMPVVGLIMLARPENPIRRRTVQTVCLVALVAIVWAINSSENHFHDIRMLKDQTAQKSSPEMPLGAYVKLWRTANDCTDGQRCRAVLVTAEGGASRAAFQVATVMGELLDNPPAGVNFRNRLFLLSGVSGGSLGLATVRQALADSTDGKPPCKASPGRAARHWLFHRSDREKDVTTSWRKCLQLLVSGDYLTPAFVGLALRDWWMSVPAAIWPHFDDRSALLEEAMERHYADITGKKDCAAFEGLCSRFGDMQRSKEHWVPALSLNSTLVERGQNVVVSEIDPALQFPSTDSCKNSQENRQGEVYPAHLPYAELLPNSYDIFELMGASSEKSVPPLKIGNSIRLSTAIVASARFPLISSQGNIRNKAGLLVGQVVDGGYYDNSGLSSILDVVDALDCLQIDSVVISIGNDPLDENPDRLWNFAERSNNRHPPLQIADRRVDSAFSPLNAFLNSREGHVLDNRFSMVNRVGFSNVIPINVYNVICVEEADPQGNCLKGRIPIDSLSMSWWLSSYVQLYIDMQDKDVYRNLKCALVHCRDNPAKMLAAAFTQPNHKDVLDPHVLGLDTMEEVHRLAP